MLVRHEQAVLMGQLVRGRTTDPGIAATTGIEYGQLLHIGQIHVYLQLWAPRPTRRTTG